MKMKHNSRQKKNVKTSMIIRRVLLIFIGCVLGMNVYRWNANSIVGNAMPMPFGTGMAVVLSGSMEPTLKVNDLVIIREADVYHEEDIVVYQTGDELIIHRIIEMNGETVLTQGDANNIADVPTDISMIKGKMVLRIPVIGSLVRILKTVPGTLIVLVSAIILMELSWKKEKAKDIEDLEAIKQEIRQLRKEQSDYEKGDSEL